MIRLWVAMCIALKHKKAAHANALENIRR